MAGRLADKRCLIVGGTSGIGLATAERFLEEGASVVIAGLPEPSPQAALDELRLTAPSEWRVWSATVDATEPGQVQYLLEQTVKMLGGLDVLFHVAGGSGRAHGDGPLHACTDDGWQFTLDLNLYSTFLTNRAAVGHFLRERQPGVILNMASVLACDPAPDYFDTAAYAAAKGGVIALSRYAAARYAADGIRVNVLAPGLIDTPGAARAATDPAIFSFLRRKQPLADGPGQPGDCAEAAVFLCGDEARLLTGVVLPVDGGWSVRDAGG